MTLDLRLVLKAGIIWGIVGILLIVAVTFLRPVLSLNIEALTLGTYAALFAGVHFAARSETRNIIVDLVGGAISGVIAALLMIAASFVLSRLLGETAFAPNTASLIAALVAGLGGGVGMIIIKRL